MPTQAIRFDNGPKLQAFTLRGDTMPIDSQVVVRSKRGLEIGTVRGQPNTNQTPQGEILHLANPDELLRWEKLQTEANDLKWFLRAKAREHGIKTKIISLEFTLDGASVMVNYSSEERIELRTLVTDLGSRTRAQIHFHAVGARDQARILGTLGVCGEENCSSLHLQDFAPVTIRMSRDQQLPLNPEKISGPCGRLLCCLQFEHEMYKELLAELPRKGAKVCSIHDESQCGKVSKVNPLKGTVEVRNEEGQSFEAKAADLKAMQ